MTPEELNEKLSEAFKEFQKNVQKPHILLAGPTRVGKSSLINKIFGEELAKEGKGEPITDSVKKYEREDIGVILYDSPGCEIGNIEKFEREVLNIDKPINLVWYCINAVSTVEPNDIESIKKFIEKKEEKGWMVSVVFTKCDKSDKERIENLKEAIKKDFSDIDIYITSSKVEHKIFKEELERLIKDAIKKLPDMLRDAFISAQKVNLKEKFKRANIAIAEHVALAFGTGFVPIPVADAPILVANQMGMIARILYIYDLASLETMLSGGAGGGIIGQLISALGKSIVGNILKLIPGIGTIIGGLINGGVASFLTTALGEAVNFSCYKLYKEILKGNKNIKKEMENFANMVKKFAKDFFKTNKKAEDYEIDD